MNNDSEISEALQLATRAGYILLQNGAEIARVEETMRRIAKYFGADSNSFFILSNGIFTSGISRRRFPDKLNSKFESFADIKYIPLKGARLDKVVDINQLSREIEQGKYTLEEANARIDEIERNPQKRAWVRVLSSAIGSFFFCSIFGGGIRDCLVTLFAGGLLWIFVLLVDLKHMSKLLVNMLGSILVTVICILALRLGIGVNLGHMIIGSVIPLVPGVAFTIGIRDLVNEDYIAGATRMLDAVVVFFGIAMGVAITLLIYSRFIGDLVEL